MTEKKSIFFSLATLYQGEGFQSFRGDLKDSGKGIAMLSGPLSMLSENLGGAAGALGGFLRTLGQGGIWETGAAGVRLVVKGLVSLYEHLTDNTKALERMKEQIDSFHKAATEGLKEVQTAFDTETKAIAASVKGKQDEITETLKLAKAEAELAEAKDKAAGGDGSTAREAAAQAQVDAQKERIALAKAAAAEEEAAALKALNAAKAQLDKLNERKSAEEYRLGLIEEQTRSEAEQGNILDRILDCALSINGQAQAAQDRIDKAMKALKDDEGMKQIYDDVKRTNEEIAQFEAAAKKAQDALDAARAKMQSAANDEIALVKHLEAETINAATEASDEAIAKFLAQMDKREEEYAHMLDVEAAETERAAQEMLKEEERLRKEAEKKEIEDNKEKVEKKNKDELKALDKMLDEAKRKLAEWEKEAAIFRNPDNSHWRHDWETQQREQARQKRKTDDYAKRLQDENERLENKNPKLLTDADRRRLEENKAWLEANGFLKSDAQKQLEALQAKRDKLLEDQANAIKAIRDKLDDLGLK